MPVSRISLTLLILISATRPAGAAPPAGWMIPQDRKATEKIKQKLQQRMEEKKKEDAEKKKKLKQKKTGGPA